MRLHLPKSSLLSHVLRGTLLSLTVCVAALAADSATPHAAALDEVLVTARGIPAPASKTPGSVGVVTQEDIRETGPNSVSEALARIPGVSLNGDSPWSGDVSIRGLNRDAVVVLIDGVRVNMTTDINGRLGVINQNDIERIEVLKGPISALYGSGSTGGVVNIITKKGHFSDKTELHGEADTHYSSNPRGPDLYGNLSWSDKRFWLFGSGGWREAASYYDGRDKKVGNTQFEDWQGKLAGAFKWTDEQTTQVQYQNVEGSHIGIPGGNSSGLPGNADLTLRENDRRMVQLIHSYTPKNSWLKESSLDLSWQLIGRYPRIDNYSSGAIAWQQPSATHETVAGRWKNVLDLGPHTVVAGAEVSNWDMRSRAQVMRVNGVSAHAMPMPDASQLVSGAFAEDDWKLAPAWTLNLGGRVDAVHITNGGGTVTSGNGGEKNDTNWGGHAGLTWAFSDPWSASVIAAASYRTPNILELYKNINLAGGMVERGDPDLKPEESRYLEFALKRAGTTLRSTTSVYANFLHNYITRERTSPTLYTMANIGSAEIYGAEQSLEWDFAKGWTAYASAAYTQGRDETHGTWLPFIAPLSGLAGVKQTIGGGWWAVEGQWAAEQNNVPSTATRGDSWAVMNVRGGYACNTGEYRHEFTLGVNNLFDASYQNYMATSRGLEYREPGINAYVNYNLSF